MILELQKRVVPQSEPLKCWPRGMFSLMGFSLSSTGSLSEQINVLLIQILPINFAPN